MTSLQLFFPPLSRLAISSKIQRDIFRSRSVSTLYPRWNLSELNKEKSFYNLEPYHMENVLNNTILSRMIVSCIMHFLL